MKTATAKAASFFLCLTAIILVLALPSSAQLIGSDARVIFLFDEDGGDTAKDFSGNGNDGDIRNAPDWVDGKFGTALELNGKDNVVVVEAPNDLPTGASPRTVCFWFKWKDAVWPDALYEMVGYGQNAPGQRLGLGLLETAWNSLGIETVLFARNFEWDADTEWHHFATTYPEGETESGKFNIYLDGVLQDAISRHDAQQLDTMGFPLVVGALPDPQLFHFPGTMDEVAIFGEELNVDEINAIMNSGLEAATAQQRVAVDSAGKIAISWGKLKATK